MRSHNLFSAAVLVFATAISLAQRPSVGQPTAPPDLILSNARVWTVDPARPEAQAVAIAGDRILAVGSNADVLKLRTSATRVEDLHGEMVLPGFNDAHTHFENATQWFYEVRLVDVDSKTEALRRLAEAAARVPAGMWITSIDMNGAAGWAAAKAHDTAFHPLEPTLAELDAAAGDHPILLKRYDGGALINTKGMRVVRLTDQTVAPAGGAIGRNPATGALTGVLYGKAASNIATILPTVTMATKLIAAAGVVHQMNAYGITSIHDIAHDNAVSQTEVYDVDIDRSYTDVNIFRNLEKQGKLTIRVYAFEPLREENRLAAFGITPRSGDDWIRFGILKEFADSGLMLAPYANHPKSTGDVTFRWTGFEDEQRRMEIADKDGWDLGIHTIGDKALQYVLDWYTEIAKVNGPRPDRRDRVIHMWYANPELIQRAGAMHLVADITPWHLMTDTAEIDAELGPERTKYAFAWRSMIDAGMRLNIVSDMPGLYSRMDVGPYDPLPNMFWATTRRLAGTTASTAWHPEQSMTMREAIEAYTINPAWSSHEENIKGSVTVGKLADLVVLSRDILAGPPDDLLRTHVVETIVGGKTVYHAQ